MARPYSELKVMIYKKSSASAMAWLLGFVMPVLAQSTVVAGEAKAPASHHANPVLETLFSVLNNTALVALVGVVVFGLIWLVQRKNVVEEPAVVTEGGADAAAPDATAADSAAATSEPSTAAAAAATEEGSSSTASESSEAKAVATDESGKSSTDETSEEESKA